MHFQINFFVSGLKYKFFKNLKKIGYVEFALALGIHNDSYNFGYTLAEDFV